MKTSRACTGMLTSDNDYFKLLKTAKNVKSTCITCTIIPVLVELISLSLTRNMNVK